MPILDGGVDSTEWRKLLPGIWFYDPALMTTAVADELHHRPRRRERHPALPRLPDRAAGREVDLPRGGLPAHPRRAARPRSSSSTWKHDITYHTYIHENVRKRFLEGFHYDAHPMGMLVSAIAALSTFYPEAGEIHDPENRYKQIVRLIAKMPTLAAACHRFSVGHAVRLPRQLARLHRELPVDAVEDRRAALRRQPRPRPGARRAVHPPRRPRAELRHHRHAHGRLRPRRPVHQHGLGRRRPLRPAPRRRQRGRHPHAHRDRVDRQHPGLHRVGEARQAPHARASATACTRATTRGPTIIKQTADEVFAITGKNPLLDIALALEEVALSDDYFISRKLYPNVDFYSGLIYQAMGFPMEMFTVLFAIPRTAAGWRTGWSCSSRTRRSPGPASSTSGPRCATTSPSASAADAARARGHDRRRRPRVARAPRPRARRAARCWSTCGRPASATPTCSSGPASTRRRPGVAGRHPGPGGRPARSWRSGPGATRFAVGDRVMAVLAGGGQAERAVVHERRRHARAGHGAVGAGRRGSPRTSPPPTTPCSPRPGWPWASGCCVHGAAGGVGTAAVLLGALAGATRRRHRARRGEAGGRRGAVPGRCGRSRRRASPPTGPST